MSSNDLIDLCIKVLTVLIGIGVGLYLKSRGSAVANQYAMRFWFENMDVVASGQRWQGERSEVLGVLSADKMGLVGFQADMLCVTKSGRFFRLSLESGLGEVEAWSLQPVTEEDARQLLQLDPDEFEKLKPRSGAPVEQDAQPKTTETSIGHLPGETHEVRN